MPPTQSYEHHAHLPVPTVVVSLVTIAALGCLIADAIAPARALGLSLTQWGLLALTVAVFLLNGIDRLYVTKLQDRIIRLEMRVRLKELLPPARHGDIERLTIQQLVGLRFASDAELPDLVRRALDERLTRDQIKREIKTWVGDYVRT